MDYGKDQTDTTCKFCKKGKYVETSVMDDISGKLHCNRCSHEVYRWSNQLVVNEQKRKEKTKKKIEDSKRCPHCKRPY